MTAQHTQNLPLALDLANWLERVSTGLSANQAAAELRRLHAESERLAALEAALAELGQRPPTYDTRVKCKLGSQFGSDLTGHWFYLQPADEDANAALTKHTGGAA